MKNDDVDDVFGLERTDNPRKDFAMFNDAAFEKAHESESHIVDCDAVYMMREVKDVDSEPKSDPKTESIDDPEDGRLADDRLVDVIVAGRKLNPSNKDPTCKPTVDAAFNCRNLEPIEDLHLTFMSETHCEFSQFDRPKRIRTETSIVPKLLPVTSNMREPVEGKFFCLGSPRRAMLTKLGAS